MERDMTQKITGIEAALMEAAGQGSFAIVGRSIVFKSGSMAVSWSHRTAKEAATILKVLRAAPKHIQVAHNV
jgi:hypothetical protein